jgi:hypothetical protein
MGSLFFFFLNQKNSVPETSQYYGETYILFSADGFFQENVDKIQCHPYEIVILVVYRLTLAKSMTKCEGIPVLVVNHNNVNCRF